MRVKRIEEKEVGTLKVGDVIEFEMMDGEKVKAMAMKQEGDCMIMCFVDCLEKEYRMNPTATNKGGWEATELRENLNNEILHKFPETIHAFMVPFDNGDLLTIPSKENLFGENRWEPMKDRRNRICDRGQQEEYEWYWLRDVVSAAYFAFVDGYGGAANRDASYSRGVRPAFKIRNL